MLSQFLLSRSRARWLVSFAILFTPACTDFATSDSTEQSAAAELCDTPPTLVPASPSQTRLTVTDEGATLAFAGHLAFGAETTPPRNGEAYVRDVRTGLITRAMPDALRLSSDIWDVQISGNGRYLLLVGSVGVAPATVGIHRFDRETGEILSVPATGFRAYAISPDGDRIAYVAVNSAINSRFDLLVYSADTRVKRVLVRTPRYPAIAHYFLSRMSFSGDGRRLAFATSMPLAGGHNNNRQGYQAYIYDFDQNLFDLVSVNAQGEPANGTPWPTGTDRSGRYVALRSSASNLVPGETECLTDDIFVRDRLLGTTTRIDRSDGTRRTYPSDAVVSSDGRWVVFAQTSLNDANEATHDIIAYELSSGERHVLGSAPGGAGRTSLSADDRVFTHDAWVEDSLRHYSRALCLPD